MGTADTAVVGSNFSGQQRFGKLDCGDDGSYSTDSESPADLALPTVEVDARFQRRPIGAGVSSAGDANPDLAEPVTAGSSPPSAVPGTSAGRQAPPTEQWSG